METYFKEAILKATNASKFAGVQKIQDLWSGYGVIERYQLQGSELASVVVKHVRLVRDKNHPRGWNTGLSHQRKLKSYEVEMEWYKNWSQQCSFSCRVPKCYGLETKGDEVLLIFEDLDDSGFEKRRTSLSPKEMRVCLKWLAHFHATFMGQEPEGLWAIGTYWHLDTRPDELKALKDSTLRSAAPEIDRKLREARYQTIVHGDAKLANFCFSSDGQKVAAVDFQYVGGGCGMKDVAYFIGSCLNDQDCEKHEAELLDYYFSVLVNVLKSKQSDIDTKEVETEWRALFPVAWADFHRFIKGWSPGHWKINSYSERLSQEVINAL